VRRQEEWGCKPGTKAKRPIPFSGIPEKQPRCPQAILRDMDADARLWVRFAERWAYAKKSGALGSYLRNPSLRALDLTEIAEEELLTIRAEEEGRVRKAQEAAAKRQGGS